MLVCSWTPTCHRTCCLSARDWGFKDKQPTSPTVFTARSWETKTCSTTTYILEILPIGKYISMKMLYNPHGRYLTKYFKVILVQLNLNALILGFMFLVLKKALMPTWQTAQLGNKSSEFPSRSRQHLNRELSQDSRPGQYNLMFYSLNNFSEKLFYPLFSVLKVHDNM